MADFQYEIKEEIGILSESKSGWRKEVNLISWNGAAPKLDIRDWAPNHEKMGKGITLSTEEAHELLNLLQKMAPDEFHRNAVKNAHDHPYSGRAERL